MSNYYERQRGERPVLAPMRRTRAEDNGIIVGFVAIAAFAFCLGMVLAAAWAGVL